MRVRDVPLTTIDGTRTSLAHYAEQVVLIVNVASKCGLTPQYAQLEELQHRYADRGFTVLGVPCNQFLGQEPGTAAEITEFCATNYGITFPLLSDPDRTVLSDWGAYGEKKNYGKTVMGVIRSTFVVDADGTLSLARYNVRAKGHVAMICGLLGIELPVVEG